MHRPGSVPEDSKWENKRLGLCLRRRGDELETPHHIRTLKRDTPSKRELKHLRLPLQSINKEICSSPQGSGLGRTNRQTDKKPKKV